MSFQDSQVRTYLGVDAGVDATTHPDTGARSGVTRWGLLIGNLLVITVTALALWQARQTELRDAERGTQATTHLLERVVAQTFEKAAVAADSVAVQLEGELRAGGIQVDGLQRRLDAATARIPQVQYLAVFDKTGRLLCDQPNVSTDCSRVRVGDRAFFEASQTQPGAGVRLYGPLTSRLDGQEILKLVRPLHLADGSFAGVVAALLPVARLRELLEVSRTANASAASLRTLDMKLLVRDPPLPAGGESDSVSVQLQAALERQPAGGVYRADARTDGVNRITAYERLQGWPVYVLTGRSADDVLATWRRSAWMAAGFLLMLGAGSVALLRAQRRETAGLRRVQHLYELAPCGHHTLDAQGRFTSINSTELAWLACTADELIGKRSPRDFFTPQSQLVFDASFPLLQQTGRLDDLELGLVGRDGRLRQVVFNARALVDAQGRFAGAMSVMNDVTPLQLAHAQVAELARLQSSMLAVDLIGFARLKDRRIVWASAGMTQLLGYSEAEFVGMPMRQLYPDDASYERFAAASYPDLCAGRSHREEVQAVHKNGSLRSMDAGGWPLSEGAGEVLLTLVDISDRMAAETLKLRAVELQALNRQLVETNRLKDEFLGNLSHELRTPLNAIMGFAQLLNANVGSGDAARLLRYGSQINTSSQQLLQMIQTQLDFAQVEAGKMSFEAQTVDLPLLLAELAGALKPQAESRQIVVRTNCAPELRRVVTDRLRLLQLLSLLLDNALKFSMPGGHVQLQALSDEPGWWCVNVADDGIGIANADQAKVFEKFVQLSSGNTKMFGGTGMGLALARQMARAMGGSLSVQSQEGEGAVFSLRLPTGPGAG